MENVRKRVDAELIRDNDEEEKVLRFIANQLQVSSNLRQRLDRDEGYEDQRHVELACIR